MTRNRIGSRRKNACRIDDGRSRYRLGWLPCAQRGEFYIVNIFDSWHHDFLDSFSRDASYIRTSSCSCWISSLPIKRPHNARFQVTSWRVLGRRLWCIRLWSQCRATTSHRRHEPCDGGPTDRCPSISFEQLKAYLVKKGNDNVLVLYLHWDVQWAASRIVWIELNSLASIQGWSLAEWPLY